MKYLYRILLVILTMTLLHASEKRAFVWVDDDNYWPAIYRGPDGKPAGIFNDIMTELFSRLDIPLKKAVYPWKRAQQMVKEGQADGMITMYTQSRQAFTRATEPIWNIGETLFFRRDNPHGCKILRIQSFDDMKGLTLVELQGAGWPQEEYAAHGIKKVIWVPNVESALNIIAKRRADLFMMFNLNALRILVQKRAQHATLSEGYQDIVAITPHFTSLPFRLLIRKDSPFVKRIDEINRILETMKHDGTYQRIRRKYSGITPPL
ncbi:ABC transporter substrate-binding protein [Nitratifractor sp.]|uniref:substrate-binding periplasmic protein n=1 Tax=Nitratifractor sp. TaxID=2268144 RepID=UPI0025F1DE02|nr:transporter substrate-binding domain-containing protein [Nitratifractor sp.]